MAIPGSVVGVGKLVTPGGAAGPVGPTAVSADAGNIATLGSDNLILVPQQTLWYQRLRSINVLGNPNFEIDQRLAGGSLGYAANGPVIDRWASFRVGTMGGTLQQTAGPVSLPGTNFAITSKFWRVTLTVQQASLAAGDYFFLLQNVEGPQWRALMSDVHSVSLLVRSSVAGLNFGLVLKDPPTSTKGLSKLCTIPAANTWTLITLPNLPVWPSGNFVVTPGSQGYQFIISLAAGSTAMTPANDTWQNGAYQGASGQSNWGAAPLSSTFDIAFVQHEPGPLCTTFQDKPFSINLDEALRYYQKTYSYGTVAGTITLPGARALMAHTAVTIASGAIQFFKPMAKVPTVTLYNHGTGAAGSVRDQGNVDHASATATTVGDSGFYNYTFTTATTGIMPVYAHYTADTGL